MSEETDRQMTEQEREIFYRYLTAIVDETKKSFLYLLKFELAERGITFQKFIEKFKHAIFHLCYNLVCCQCPPGANQNWGSQVIQPEQLMVLLDTVGGKLPGHNPESKSAPHCCCPVNPNLKLDDLDFTLARFLLVNFTSFVQEGSLERYALDTLVESRNKSLAHAKKGSITDVEYRKYMADIEKSLLVLAKVYKKESVTKQRLRDISRQPLNMPMCIQLQNTLLLQNEALLKLLEERDIPDCLTKDIESCKVIEGCDAHFEIWTKEEGLCMEWFKEEVKIVESDRFRIEADRKMHSLAIRNTHLSDKGMYTVRFRNIERQAHLDVTEYFRKNFQNINVDKGQKAEFMCEVIEDSFSACWIRKRIKLKNDGKYEIQHVGRSHRLCILNCDLNDTGDYTVIINNRTRTAYLTVKDKDLVTPLLKKSKVWRVKILRNLKMLKRHLNSEPLMEELSNDKLISATHMRPLGSMDKSLSLDYVLSKSIRSITDQRTFESFKKAIIKANPSIDPDKIPWDAQMEDTSADDLKKNASIISASGKSELKRILTQKRIIEMKDDFLEQSVFSWKDYEEIVDSLVHGSKDKIKGFIENFFERIDKGSAQCLINCLRRLQNDKTWIQSFLEKLNKEDQTQTQVSNVVTCEEGAIKNKPSEKPVEGCMMKLTIVGKGGSEIELNDPLKKSVQNHISDILQQTGYYIEGTKPGCLEIYLRSIDGNITKKLPTSLTDGTLHNLLSKIINDEEMKKSLPPGRYTLETRIVTFDQSGHATVQSCDNEFKRIHDNIIGANRSFLKKQLDAQTFFKALLSKQIDKNILKRLENTLNDVSDCEKQADILLDMIQEQHLEEMFFEVLKEKEMSFIYNRLETFKKVYSSDFASLRMNLGKNISDLLKVDIDDVKDVFIERNMFESLFEKIEEDNVEGKSDQGMATLLNEIIKSGPVAMLTLVYALYVCKMTELADLLLKPSENVHGLKLEKGNSNSLQCTDKEFLFEGNYDIIITEPDYFIENLTEKLECVEGDDVELACTICEANITAHWSKDGKIVKPSAKYKITDIGKSHRLSIIQLDLQDAGEYSVTTNNRMRSSTIQVKEYFTLALNTRACLEGEDVHFECEVLDDNQTAQWFKDGTEVSTSDKYKVEKHGRLHRLVVNNIKPDDKGEYSVIIKNCVRRCELVVQVIPPAIRQLSEEDKGLYLEIIKSGTETRYYIRIVIIGKNGVGKTCLLRRLLGESIDDVKRTDGIDVVHRCKIRLSDGQWIVDKGTNRRKDLMTRIKIAINAKKTEDLKNQLGTSKENRPTTVKRKSEVEMEVSKLSALSINDKRQENCEALSLPDDNEFMTPFNSLNQLEMSEKKIETRLEKVLTETILNELSQFINDINKYDIPDEDLVDCGFWDFAGQRQYYPTHSIFLNPNAVHLLVADIMTDVKQINTEVGYDQIGEYMDFWFDSIHSCRDVEDTKDSTEEFLNPPVIVVCTGIDKCKDKLDERKNVFRRQLISLLHNEEKQKHLRRICFLSNTEPSDETFSNLRNSIFEFGKIVETFREKLPLKWIHLEQAIDILCGAGINILSWSDMADLASKCSVEDENEVSLFLKYHHKIGSIIYFESLKDSIILNPKWLADAFSCFVSDNYDDDLKLTRAWRTLEDTGELSPYLIVKLFKKEPQREFDKHKDHLLKVMEMFGIIVKLPTLLEGGQKQTVPTYYMPCMISAKTSFAHIYDVFGAKGDACTRTPWLCIQFDFMPFDFFNHILCHYISKYSVCIEALSRRAALYHGAGVFFLDNTKLQKFILCFSKNTVAMQIWQWKKLEQGKCKSMLEELESVIHNTKDKYEPRRVSYTLKIKCADGDIHITAGRNSYTELANLRGKEYFCEEHNEKHDTRVSFQTWFEEFSEASSTEDKRRANKKQNTDLVHKAAEIKKLKDTVPWIQRE